MAANVGYLLDTNILLQLMRGNPFGQHIERQYNLGAVGLNRCAICVVTVGEMFSLAGYFNWGQPKTEQLELLLNRLVWIDINDPKVFRAYAEIDQFNVKHGKSLDRNDVWIAATARATQMTLLTTDKDFDPLDGTFLQRIWIDPHQSNT